MDQNNQARRSADLPLEPHLNIISVQAAPQLPLLAQPLCEIQPEDSRAADTSPVLVYLASLAPSGRRSMLTHLRSVAHMLGAQDISDMSWEKLRYAHVAAIKATLVGRGLAAATINTVLAAIRGVAREAWNLHYLPVEELERIRAIKRVHGERLPAGRRVVRNELQALMNACAQDRRPAGKRDAALIAVLYAGGLRRSELVTLQVADYTAESGALRIMHAKGNKQRVVYLATSAANTLADWLECRGREPGALFVPINKGGQSRNAPMSAQAVYNALKKRANGAGLAQSLSPHDLRRSFVSDLLAAGADISTVQQLAGHANIATTVRYDRRGESAKKKVANLLDLPVGEAEAA